MKTAPHSSGHRAVPFVDLNRTHERLCEELRSAFQRVMERGDFVLGEDVERFEREFSDYIGTAEAIGVGSGTAAITIALQAAGIGRGDEVIVPAHTYISSALGVAHAGAVPIFCDVETATGLIDLESAASRISERTVAIMAVHLYGQACDMDAVEPFAQRHGLAVVEDAAQAHGATWRQRKVGSFGLVSVFSFFPSKNLGAMGDGGMICTNDPAIATTARALGNIGQQAKGEHALAGYNERLDTVQAALLRVKLGHLDAWNGARRDVARWYRALLPASIRTLPERLEAHDVYHLFPVRVAARDDVARALEQVGVHTGVHYSRAVHQQSPFLDPAYDCPVSEAWAKEELSLPMFPYLTKPEVHRTCAALGAVAGTAATPLANRSE